MQEDFRESDFPVQRASKMAAGAGEVQGAQDRRVLVVRVVSAKLTKKLISLPFGKTTQKMYAEIDVFGAKRQTSVRDVRDGLSWNETFEIDCVESQLLATDAQLVVNAHGSKSKAGDNFEYLGRTVNHLPPDIMRGPVTLGYALRGKKGKIGEVELSFNVKNVTAPANALQRGRQEKQNDVAVPAGRASASPLPQDSHGESKVPRTHTLLSTPLSLSLRCNPLILSSHARCLKSYTGTGSGPSRTELAQTIHHIRAETIDWQPRRLQC
jgi:hypothetical protein